MYVVVVSLVNVVTDSLAGVFIGPCTVILVEVGLFDVKGIAVVTVTVIALEFALPVSYAVDVLARRIVGVLIDTLTAVLPEANIDVLPALITVEISMATSFENLLFFD